MEVVLILFGVAGLVWFMAMGRHLSVGVGALLVVLIGATFGHPFFNVDLGPLPLTIDRVLWVWLILASLVLWKLGRSRPKPLNRTDLIVIALALLLIASTFMHDWRYKDNLPIARLLFFNLLPIGLYFVAKHCQMTAAHLKVFYLVLALFGVYLGLTAIFEQRGVYDLVFPKFIVDPQYFEFLGRARGPFLNPVSCGVYLSTCLLASGFLWPKAHPLGRVFIGLGILICVSASFLTLTRSVWVACAVSVGILFWFPAKGHIRGTLVVVGTLLLVLASLTLSDKLNRFQRDKEVSAAAMAESVTLRPMLAFVAIKMAADKPVFGHGFGQYTAAKKPYHYDETNGMQLSRILPYMQHNVFLSYLTETGLVGASLLLMLLITLAFKSWQLWKAGHIPLVERQFGLLGIAMVANYTINGMFHDVSIIPHIGAIFFLTLGVTENLSASKVPMLVAIAPDNETDRQTLAQAA